MMSNQNDDLEYQSNLDDPNNPAGEQQSNDPDDFANFDPARYLQKRGIKTYGGDAEREAEAVSRQYGQDRGRGRRGRREDDLRAEDVPVGLFGRLGRVLQGGEGMRLYAEILGEALPIAGRYLPIIGCFVVIICVIVCGGGYLLIHSLTTH